MTRMTSHYLIADIDWSPFLGIGMVGVLVLLWVYIFVSFVSRRVKRRTSIEEENYD
jgi:hypothetical protein